LAKDFESTGVTLNVFFPSGITNTHDFRRSGFRARQDAPARVHGATSRVVSDAAEKVTGRRFLAVHWDTKLPREEAAEKAGAPVAWTSIATMPVTPSRS
jgi:hypothetical protein